MQPFQVGFLHLTIVWKFPLCPFLALGNFISKYLTTSSFLRSCQPVTVFGQLCTSPIPGS